MQTTFRAYRALSPLSLSRIHPDYLRTLLQGHAWRRAAVVASISGGWFVRRLEVAV